MKVNKSSEKYKLSMKESLEKLLKTGQTVVMPSAPPFPHSITKCYDWTIPQVVKYLTDVMELPQYSNNFMRAAVTGRILITLNSWNIPDSIKNVDHELHLKKILEHAKILREEVLNSTSPSEKKKFFEWTDIELSSFLFHNGCQSCAVVTLIEGVSGLAYMKKSVDERRNLFNIDKDISLTDKSRALTLLGRHIPDEVSNNQDLSKPVKKTAIRKRRQEKLLLTTKSEVLSSLPLREEVTEHDDPLIDNAPENLDGTSDMDYLPPEYNISDDEPVLDKSEDKLSVSFSMKNTTIHTEADDVIDQSMPQYNNEAKKLNSKKNKIKSNPFHKKVFEVKNDSLYTSNDKSEQDNGKLQELEKDQQALLYKMDHLVKTIENQSTAIKKLSNIALSLQNQNSKVQEAIAREHYLNREVIEALEQDRELSTSILNGVIENYAVQAHQLHAVSSAILLSKPKTISDENDNATEYSRRHTVSGVKVSEDINELLEYDPSRNNNQRPSSAGASHLKDNTTLLIMKSNNIGSEENKASNAVKKNVSRSVEDPSINIPGSLPPIEQIFSTAILTPTANQLPEQSKMKFTLNQTYVNQIDDIPLLSTIENDALRSIAMWEDVIKTYQLQESTVLFGSDSQFHLSQVATLWLRLGMKMYNDYKDTLSRESTHIADQNPHIEKALGFIYTSVAPVVNAFAQRLGSNTIGTLNEFMIAAGMVFVIGLVKRILSTSKNFSMTPSDMNQLSLLLSQLEMGTLPVTELSRENIKDLITDNLCLKLSTWEKFDAICQRLDPSSHGFISLPNLIESFLQLSSSSNSPMNFNSIKQSQFQLNILLTQVVDFLCLRNMALSDSLQLLVSKNMSTTPSFKRFVDHKGHDESVADKVLHEIEFVSEFLALSMTSYTNNVEKLKYSQKSIKQIYSILDRRFTAADTQSIPKTTLQDKENSNIPITEKISNLTGSGIASKSLNSLDAVVLKPMQLRKIRQYLETSVSDVVSSFQSVYDNANRPRRGHISEFHEACYSLARNMQIYNPNRDFSILTALGVVISTCLKFRLASLYYLRQLMSSPEAHEDYPPLRGLLYFVHSDNLKHDLDMHINIIEDRFKVLWSKKTNEDMKVSLPSLELLTSGLSELLGLHIPIDGTIGFVTRQLYIELTLWQASQKYSRSKSPEKIEKSLPANDGQMFEDSKNSKLLVPDDIKQNNAQKKWVSSSSLLVNDVNSVVHNQRIHQVSSYIEKLNHEADRKRKYLEDLLLLHNYAKNLDSSSLKHDNVRDPFSNLFPLTSSKVYNTIKELETIAKQDIGRRKFELSKVDIKKQVIALQQSFLDEISRQPSTKETQQADRILMLKQAISSTGISDPTGRLTALLDESTELENSLLRSNKDILKLIDKVISISSKP